MAITVSDIGLQEPSTITNRVGAVSITRNSTVMQQELLSLADPESTVAAFARVRDTTPNSTDYGLVVREAVPQSTVVAVSSISGAVIVRSTQNTLLATIYQSTAADLNVTVAGYVAPSTVVTVSTGSVRVHQSSAADLNVTVAGYSTTVNISSVGGAVIMRSSAANALVSVYQSTAADLNVTVAGYVAPSTTITIAALPAGLLSTTAANSNSSALNVRVVGGPSTAGDFVVRVLQSTATDLRARVDQGVGNSTAADRWRVMTANSSAADYNAVRLVDSSGTGYHGPANPLPIAVTDSSNAVVKPGDSANNAVRVNVVAGAAGGSTVVTVSQLLDSSGGSIAAGDSANSAIRVNVVAGAAGGSTVVTVSTVTGRVAIAAFHGSDGIINVADSTNNAINVNVVAGAAAGSTIVTVSTGSVRVHQSTQADLRATMYQSTAADLNVTVAGYVPPSTIVTVSTGSVRVHQSTQADLRATIYQSTAADLNVTVAGYVAPSTIVTVSTGSVRVHQSTQADLRTTVYQSTAADLNVSVGAFPAGLVSSGGAAAGSSAVSVRQVMPTRLSTRILAYIQTPGGSTTIVSSVAGLAIRVFAFSVTSSVVANSSVAFLSSAASERWGLILGTGSSGVSGANLAVAPPGSLFETTASEALLFTATSSGHYSVSVSWFTTPT